MQEFFIRKISILVFIHSIIEKKYFNPSNPKLYENKPKKNKFYSSSNESSKVQRKTL